MKQRITIAGHCVAYLMEHGPAPLEELASQVKSAELTRARDATGPTKQALAHDPRVLQLFDGMYDATAHILEGSWFTTRIRYRQPGRRQLFVDRELDPLLPMVQRQQMQLQTGGHVEINERGPASTLVGPTGWLPDCPAGGLLGFQLRAGTLSVVPVQVDEESVAEDIARVRALTTRHAHMLGRPSYYGSESLGSVIVSALVEAPDLLRTPLPPLDEVLALPRGTGPSDWSRHLLDGGDPGMTVQLNGVPHALGGELKGRARRMGVTLSEYVVLQLAANAWRWQPPCRHDLRRQREEAEMARRGRDRLYDEDGRLADVIDLGYDSP